MTGATERFFANNRRAFFILSVGDGVFSFFFPNACIRALLTGSAGAWVSQYAIFCTNTAPKILFIII